MASTTEFDDEGHVLLEHIYLGTTRSITRQNNEVVWGWESKPFGDSAVVDLIGLGYQLRFAGQYEDQESGLFDN